jgi:ribosomal protein S12 methylthiotransferase accessory factor
MISGTRDDLTREMFVRGPSQAAPSEIRSRPSKAFSDIPSAQGFTSIDHALEYLLRRMSLAGIDEPLIVDLSHSGIPAAVVRVIAPGLEGSCDAPGYMAGMRARRLAAFRDDNVDRN